MATPSMSIAQKVQTKIRLAIVEAQLNGMKYMRNYSATADEEYETEQERIIDDLYRFISEIEPKTEAEVV